MKVILVEQEQVLLRCVCGCVSVRVYVCVPQSDQSMEKTNKEKKMVPTLINRVSHKYFPASLSSLFLLSLHLSLSLFLGLLLTELSNDMGPLP